MKRSAIFRNAERDRRRLERAAARGDPGAKARFGPYALDEELRKSGKASGHYGRMLLGLVPPGLRVPGTEVVWPALTVAAPCVIHELDGKVSEVEQERQGGHRTLRPCWALSLPDGYGRPGRSDARVGLLLTVAMSARPVSTDWRDSRAKTTGAAVVSVTGAYHAGMGPYLYLERRLGAGWKDDAFVRAAGRLYDVGLERAVLLGPMGEVARRADRLLGEVSGVFPDSRAASVPGYEGYSERMRRRQSFIDLLRLKAGDRLPWIMAYPFDERTSSRRWSDEPWPADDFVPWTDEEVAGWNRLLDEIEARKDEWARDVRRSS